MPLLITDFLVTGALAVAFILFLKTVVLATPLGGVGGLREAVGLI